MVTRFVPRSGDIVWINFDPHVGREQAKRRPALVLTDENYNRISGLAVVCALTSRRKGYPFELPIKVGKVDGAVLTDHIKSFDWEGRNVTFHSKADPLILSRVRAYLEVLLGMR